MSSQYITCVDCGTEFEHSERDQEFYTERGYSLPKRCKACRTKKKARFDKPNNGFQREDRRRDSNEYGV